MILLIVLATYNTRGIVVAWGLGGETGRKLGVARGNEGSQKLWLLYSPDHVLDTIIIINHLFHYNIMSFFKPKIKVLILTKKIVKKIIISEIQTTRLIKLRV